MGVFLWVGRTHMNEDGSPGFEQPDIEHLRRQMKRPSIWSRTGEGIGRFLRSHTTWTAILAVAIFATLTVGYLALTGNL